MVAGGAASVTIAVGAGARADEPCARVVAPEDLAPPWVVALAELRRQIALLPTSDCRPMTLSIEASDRAVRVVAVTPDGRRAERTVHPGEALVATALGLLMAIPTEGPPPPPTALAPAPIAPAPTAVERTAPPLVGVPSTVALWAGLAAGVRLTAPTAVTVLDVEGRVDLLLDRWLLMSTIRSALVSCLGAQGVDCDVYNDVSVGVGAGRRIRAGAAAVDLALEPSVVWMHMEYDVSPGSESQSVAGSEVALRVDASVRLAVPLGESWALTLTVDAGLAPTLLGTTRLDLPPNLAGMAAPPPPFPAWTGAVRLGASGALL